jgi:hypothetical protein
MRITHQDLLMAIGELKGRFDAFESIPQRVAKLEQTQSWLKGLLFAVGGMCGWLSGLAWAR